MAAVKELLRAEEDGTLSFGDYTLADKTKLDGFEFQGDLYKVKTFSEITKLENQIEALVPWLELDVPMNLKGTGKTELLLGTMPGETELSTVYEKIAENCPETEGVDVQIIHKDQDSQDNGCDLGPNPGLDVNSRPSSESGRASCTVHHRHHCP